MQHKRDTSSPRSFTDAAGLPAREEYYPDIHAPENRSGFASMDFTVPAYYVFKSWLGRRTPGQRGDWRLES